MSLAGLLRSVAEVREERSELIPVLMKSLLSHREIKAPGPDSWLAVSKLPSLCPKAMVLAHRLDVTLVDDIDLKSRWRFDRGTAMHVIVQELWLGPMGHLLGGWQCPRCCFTHGAIDGERQDWATADAEVRTGEGGKPMVVMPSVSWTSAVAMPSECARCKCPNAKWTRFRFVEPEFVDEELRIRGRGDGILHLAPHAKKILDLKNVDDLNKSFTRRDGTFIPSVKDEPRKEHVQQLQWYLDSAGYRTGCILYMNPGASSAEDAMAEHEVAYDPYYIHAEKEKIRGLRQALAEKDRPVPPCPYDGASPFGDCACVEVAGLWARARR